MLDYKKYAKPYKTVNWNNIDDYIDKMTWEKVTSQFWLDTRVPVSKDLGDWKSMSEVQKRVVMRVFGGLSGLDTLQSEDGVFELIPYAENQHEVAVLNNFMFMESVHSKYYSTIYSTFNTPKEIEEIYHWVDNNKFMMYKINRIQKIYKEVSELKKRIASVFLESFLFYSGFYAPLRFLGEKLLVSTAEGIKLIIRDESVHGSYIGYKFKKKFEKLSEKEQNELQEWAYALLFELYQNEEKYTEMVYDEIGWTADVKRFLRYNGNKALNNLGFPSLFNDESGDVNPVVMNGLSVATGNFDFFSTIGTYLMDAVESTKDSDYDGLLSSL